jgi:hypothetical protein
MARTTAVQLAANPSARQCLKIPNLLLKNITPAHKLLICR